MRVQPAELFDARLVSAALHEQRKGELLRLRTALGVVALDLPVYLSHGRRKYHVAYLHRSEQRRRERSQVYDPAGLVDALQSEGRLSEVAELAVVVILDDVAVVCLGPGEKLISSRDRHHGACRKLVLRRYVSSAGYVHRQLFDRYAVASYGDLADGEAAVAEHAVYRAVARVLKRDVFYTHQTEYRSDVRCDLLRSGGDDDAVRSAAHASCRIDVFRDLVSESFFALRVALEEKGLRIFVQDPGYAFLPFYKIEG